MHGNKLSTLITAAALLVMCASAASALPRFARATNMACATCHTNVAGGADLTDAGKAFKSDSTKVPAASVEGAEFTSNRKCKTCHLTEYKSWQDTPHAKSLEVLKTGDPKKIEEMATRAGVTLSGPAFENEVCLSCHVTGYKLTGGYPAADTLKNAALAFVTCEACHGPGSKHVAAEKAVKKTFINGKVSETLCKGCHTPTMSPKFDFATYKTKGVHAFKAAE
ncbi:MAG TPA: cytochrome c family protein [Candidatus Eisenbacteria bacterium]|jgi:mono/diheme cytochrome c family protein